MRNDPILNFLLDLMEMVFFQHILGEWGKRYGRVNKFFAGFSAINSDRLFYILDKAIMVKMRMGKKQGLYCGGSSVPGINTRYIRKNFSFKQFLAGAFFQLSCAKVIVSDMRQWQADIDKYSGFIIPDFNATPADFMGAAMDD